VRTFSGIKLYNVLALPILLYGIEICTLREEDEKLFTSVKMKFFRRTFRYTLFGNEDILKELKVEPAYEKLRRYKSNWVLHVTRTNNNRMPKLMQNCRPNKRIRLGRPLKRLLNEAETGLSSVLCT
jgi:hypothetical protein